MRCPSAGRALSGGQFPFAVFLVDAGLASAELHFLELVVQFRQLELHGVSALLAFDFLLWNGHVRSLRVHPNLRPRRPPVLLTHGLSHLRAKKSLAPCIGVAVETSGGLLWVSSLHEVWVLWNVRRMVSAPRAWSLL